MPTIDMIEITEFDSDVESQNSNKPHVEKLPSAPPKL
jgi:hypothetical protein